MIYWYTAVLVLRRRDGCMLFKKKKNYLNMSFFIAENVIKLTSSKF